jgi:hypothetical protein
MADVHSQQKRQEEWMTVESGSVSSLSNQSITLSQPWQIESPEDVAQTGIPTSECLLDLIRNDLNRMFRRELQEIIIAQDLLSLQSRGTL